MSVKLSLFTYESKVEKKIKFLHSSMFTVFFMLLTISFLMGTSLANEAKLQTDIVRTSLDLSPLIAAPKTPLRLKLSMLSEPAAPEIPLNAESLLFPSNAKRFTSYRPLQVIQDMRPIWFRARIAPYGVNLADPLVIDLQALFANQFSGTPILWVLPNHQKGAPQSIKPNLTGFYPLPPAHQGMTVFIQLPSPPSIAFAPVIRTEMSLTKLDRYGKAVSLIALAFLLLAALGRGILEQREWRLWAAVYVASLFIAALWGAPRIAGGFVNLWDLPALLAPGFALLLLPHVGRHMMRTRDFAPAIDTYLIFCTIPGFAWAVIPLIPQQTWTVAFIGLWPLCVLLTVPALIIACVRRLPGAKVFLLSSVLLPLGLFPLVTLFKDPIGLPISVDILTLMPLFASIASACVLVISGSPKSLQGAIRKTKAVNERTQQAEQNSNMPANTASTRQSDLSSQSSLAQLPAQALAQSKSLESHLTEVFDQLFQTLAALEQHSLPPEVLPHVQALTSIGRIVSNTIHTGLAPSHTMQSGQAEYQNESFDLHTLFLTVHNAVSAEAEQKNLALAWFTAPHLLQKYEGPRALLEESLLALLRSSVQATQRGMVQIRAQRVSESTDPGHLLFTISDTGTGMPPMQRNAFALNKTWEMMAHGEGTLHLESAPTGTTLSFSLHLKPLQDAYKLSENRTSTFSKPLNLLIVSDVSSTRELLAYYLDELPHEIQEAQSPAESFELYKNCPSSVFIFDGDLDIHTINTAIANIRTFEGDYDFPLAPIIALVNSPEQGELLHQAGCSHIFLKPISRTDLRHLILRVAPVSQSTKEIHSKIDSHAGEGEDVQLFESQTSTQSVQNDELDQIAPDQKEQTNKADQTRSAAQNSVKLETISFERPLIPVEEPVIELTNIEEKSEPLQLAPQENLAPVQQENLAPVQQENLVPAQQKNVDDLQNGEMREGLAHLAMTDKAEQKEELIPARPTDVPQEKALEIPSLAEPALSLLPKPQVTDAPAKEQDMPKAQAIPKPQAEPKSQEYKLSLDKTQESSEDKDDAESLTWYDEEISTALDQEKSALNQEKSKSKQDSLEAPLPREKKPASQKIGKAKSLPLFSMLDTSLDDSEEEGESIYAPQSEPLRMGAEPLLMSKAQGSASTSPSNELLPDKYETLIQDMHGALAANDFTQIHVLATHLIQLAGQQGLHELKGYAIRLVETAEEQDAQSIAVLLQDMQTSLVQ